jgi:hypothetical protein
MAMTKEMFIELDAHISEVGYEEVGYSDFFYISKQLFGFTPDEEDYNKWLVA